MLTVNMRSSSDLTTTQHGQTEDLEFRAGLSLSGIWSTRLDLGLADTDNIPWVALTAEVIGINGDLLLKPFPSRLLGADSILPGSEVNIV